jgi:hypothetical protein
MHIDPSFRLFQCSKYTLWAAIELTQTNPDQDNVIDGLAHFFTFTGTSPSVSKKLIKGLRCWVNSPQDKRHFCACLASHTRTLYKAVLWDLPSQAFAFLTSEPALQPSYHLPLLELGVHPKIDDTLIHALANHLIKLNEDQVQGKADVPIEDRSILSLFERLCQTRLNAVIYAVADILFLILQDEPSINRLGYLERFASSVSCKEMSFSFNESVFDLRMSDPKNAHKVMLTLEFCKLPQPIVRIFMNRLNHPSLIEHYRMFDRSYYHLITNQPVDWSQFDQLMKRAFQCYVGFRLNNDSKTKLHKFFWETKDLELCAFIAECPQCIDYQYLSVYATSIRDTVSLASAFNKFHWRIIFTRCITNTTMFAVLAKWAHRDITQFILTGDCATVFGWKSMIADSCEFRWLLSSWCANFVECSSITESQFWQLGHILGTELSLPNTGKE